MSNTVTKQTREERLAARLRENLRRRKAQARALSGARNEQAPARGTGDQASHKSLP